MSLALVALLIGAYFAYRYAPRRADHVVRVKGQSGEEVWIFNIRDMWVELRQTSYTVNAKVRYELRRQGAGHWEMRLDPVPPAPRSLLFPTAALSGARIADEDAPPEQPWTRCGPPVDDQLEAAHRSYNGLEDSGAA